MTEPTCRTCYYLDLPEAAKERFLAEPQTMPAYYCPVHQKVQNDMYAALRGVRLQEAKIDIHGTITGRIVRGGPEPQFGGKR